MLSTLLNYVGVALILHAAYSLKHYNTLVEATVSVSALKYPMDVLVELAVAFILVVLGQMMMLNLRNIRKLPSVQGKTYDESTSESDFMLFNSRRSNLQKRVASRNK